MMRKNLKPMRLLAAFSMLFFHSITGFAQNYGFEVTPGTTPPTGWTAVTGTWNTVTTAANVRTGAQSMSITDPATSGTTLANTNTIAVVPTTGTHYVIVMAHAKSNIPNGVLYLGTRLGTTNTLNPSSTTTGQPVNMGTAAFTRIISVTASTVAAGNYGVSMRAFRNASTTGTTIYIDDVIAYASTTNVPDTFAPNSVLSATIASGSPNVATWTNAGDNLTNSSLMKGTVILRSSAATTTPPVLNSQSMYHPTNAALGITSFTQAGTTWDVVGVINDSSITSFNDVTAIPSVPYTYAIASFDNAYNYSTAVLGTTTSSPMTFNSVTVTPVTTAAASGTIAPVARIDILTAGNLSPLTLNQLYLNTLGSTNASANIISARVYSTQNSTAFSTANLYGSYSAPSGSFVVSGTQTLAPGINYFWLAYELAGTIPNCNTVDGGADSITVDGTIRIPATANPAGSVSVFNPLNGTYTIDTLAPAGCGTTNFKSLKTAIDYAATFGVSGPVVLNMATSNPAFAQGVDVGVIPGISATNTLTINGNGNTIASASTPVLSFTNAKYITIDSLNVTHTAATGVGVFITGGSKYITIRKSTINAGTTSTATSNCAVAIAGSNTALTTVGDNGQYITLERNTIIGGYYGVTIIGNTGYANNSNNIIRQNMVRDFYLYGIYMANGDSNLIEYNDINRATRSTVSTFYGIYYNLTRNTKIRNNKIHTAGTASYTAYPIYITNTVNSVGFETEISNNLIYNIQNTGIFYGIYSLTTSLSGVKIYHNTINYDVPTGSTSAVRGFFGSVAITNVEFKNNIINITGGGTGVKTGIYVTTASTTFFSNNNVVNVASSASNNFGYWGAVQATLANWQTASSQDAASVTLNPVFTSTTDLTPLSINIDNLGTPVGITTDFFGNARSATNPDAGAIEFAGASGDLKVMGAELKRASQCYSTNDTLTVTIQNLLGATVDFSVDPLTVVWRITGAINSTDSLTITTGTLAVGNNLTVVSTNINRSVAGSYALKAYIKPNAVNTTFLNDTLATINGDIKPILSTSKTPASGIVTGSTDTVVISASSPLFPGGSVFFSEICHWRGATGAAPTGGWPTYLVADDYVELTGVPNSSIAGYIMEEWIGTTMEHSVTFPAGTVFSPTGNMILATGQLTTSTPSPANFYYHTGNTQNHGSGDVRGYIIKNSFGTIVDAVTYGAYVFPAAAGVTAANWTGSTSNVSSAGIRLTAPDNNTGSTWSVESAVERQDPNTLNPAVTVPIPVSLTGFNWYYLGSPISTSPRITVGPYSIPGVYKYVAEYINSCGSFYDTVTITATATVPVKLVSFTAAANGKDAQLNWATASESNNSHFEIQRSEDGNTFTTVASVKGNGTTQTSSVYAFTDELAANVGDVLYYRLKQVDFDGAETLSKTAKVSFGAAATHETVVFPNPFTGKVSVDVTAAEQGELQIEVLDLQGRKLIQEQALVKAGNNTLTISKTEQLDKGLYFIKTTINNHTKVNTIIKQ